MTEPLQRTLRPSADVLESTVGAETVLLHLGRDAYYGLDRVGTRIWNLLKEGVSAEAICCAVAGEYDASLEMVRSDCDAFLADLLAHGIVIEF